ncbi:MAG: DUF559 domain-containing protein [Chitinispirillaceae bacterium]|nr:DUF559 domain-containing protein [Chitinispirillaceae bacterium]
MDISYFDKESFFTAMKAFFEGLNIPVNCFTEKPVSPEKILSSIYKGDSEAHRLMSTVYFLGMIDDNAFEGVDGPAELREIRKDYDGILVFGVELGEREKNLFPSRGQLAEITRCFNREYHYTPVIVLFKYSVNGEPFISFTSCERIAYKQQWREGDKTGRVSILKDIRIRQPHTGHLRILDEMAIIRTGKKAVNSFAGLNKYWQAVFSVQILNQSFYNELFNWYLWACKTAVYPKPASDETIDATHISISVIRMLTRIIFCWFIKEKCLLPDSLFDPEFMAGFLKKFDPVSTDKSDYYTAILQNLFFATLNTEMPKDSPDSRRFQRPSDNNGRSEDYLDHLVYRYEDRFVDSKKALELFSSIPFLNGGLFECLDTRDIKNGKEYRYDGFSKYSSKQPKVPNVLFFGEDEDADLSGDFGGDKKKQKVSVRGLIRILDSYKFTIAENTPLEQEIALDPELLGKVFENLLASYNPETRTTARKQTGSYYTPREIVDYMVDESLIAYLKTRLESPLNSPPFKEGCPQGGVVDIHPAHQIHNIPYLPGSISNTHDLLPLRKELRNNLTPAEAALWNILKNGQLENRKFRRQHGAGSYILDFYCPEERLAVELDGEVHNDPQQAEYDKRRDAWLAEKGIRVLRFENRLVFERPEDLKKCITGQFGWYKGTTRAAEDARMAAAPGSEDKNETTIRETRDKKETTTPVFDHPSLKGGELMEKRLRLLFDLSISGNPFADDEKTGDAIIEHLNNCRILDPACGSGAFPIGVLHKMVFALGKLDPNNKKWKQAQLKKAVHDLETVKREFLDPENRENAIERITDRIRYIEESFGSPNHELDYTRKLFLIENCIYGVDIQNIAVQISKLRFFISLMVDQRADENKPNIGILSLPNLETKFVAANTLIGLDKEGNLLELPEVKKLEKELREIRQRIFFTRKYSEKKKLKKQESDKREELKEAIRKGGFGLDTANKVAEWNPFDPVHSADFFDVETMFGFEGGFDVVIGNPPYVRQEAIKELKPLFKDTYACFTGVADLYVYFYEKAISLLNPGHGVLSYISSNKYFRAGYGEKLRQYLGENTSIIRLIDFGDAPVFDAIAYPCIIVARKEKPTGNKPRVMSWEPGQAIEDFAQIFRNNGFEMAQKELTAEGWRLESRETLRLLDKLKKAGKPLGEYVKGRFYRGILTGLNEAFVIDAETRERLIREDGKSEEVIKPFLRGRDVKRWRVEYANLFLIFTRHGIDIDRYPAIKKYLHRFKKQLMPGGPNGRKPGSYEWYEIQDNIAYWEEFERPKIIYPDIFEHCSFSWDENKFYAGNTTYFIPTDEKMLCGILNSYSFEWYYGMVSNKVRGGYMRAFSDYMQDVPIPTMHTKLKTYTDHLINELLNPLSHTLPLESRLDALVAHLYSLTEEEYTIILDALKLPDPVRMACLNEYRDIARRGMGG